ncbi:glycosyltransferase family A protein [Conexibacter sp. JD483]|uniref:glycosyltransferase n=1 Tax=unclassified Conexibacter TaxID=2627773 RepID=UPI002715F1A4|nr:MULTISPECIES: glycosyltransferase family A protein [unclassified Conexibacter]MDO8186433.1 glycosyltransferase family A protein [Conexibacter sp. CPCC 205706]MDO8200002.1 glycosyltransferase family A protein [Conexibacter sp. CPCC 205762]MDR9370555.1 glycosyltransferase family A protein [Conexibacter sp. JD483]
MSARELVAADAPVACVAIPARNERERIGACIEALAAQRAPGPIEAVLVLDACSDDTGPVASAAAARHGLRLHVQEGPGAGSGPARRIAMDAAAQRLHEAGVPHGLLATTDADSRVAPDWIARQLVHLARGAGAVAGRIELDPVEAGLLPGHVLTQRAALAEKRLERVRRRDPQAQHHHFGGASIGLAASTYARVGGLEPRDALEDDAFAERLLRHRIAIARVDDVRVVTSARTHGRATRGLAIDLAALCAREQAGRV